MTETQADLQAVVPSPEVAARRGMLVPLFAGGVVLCGMFAPLLANDVPLVARVDGTWWFPAFADLVGTPPVGPHDLSWKQWWARLPAGGDDFAWMPPWPYGPSETDATRFRAAPSWSHPLGNDDTGRDLLARLVHGAGSFLGLGVPAVLAAGVVGSGLGALAGYRGGFADVLVQRAIELFVCFPLLLFLLFAAAFFGNSSLGMILVLAAMFWPSFARIVRGSLLSLRERDFVHVARGLGVSEWRILGRHLLPQVSSQIGVTAAFCMASAVVAESTLSFLGIGPGSLGSSWGTMLRQGADHAATGAWHLWLFPTIAVVAVVLSCHALAERGRRGAAAG
jgi:peptide/nickel transport system permease protein